MNTENLTNTDPSPSKENFLSKSKQYIFLGIGGIVVITIVTGILFSMGSSSRLQGMLDKRVMEQNQRINVISDGLKSTEVLINNAEEIETPSQEQAQKGPIITSEKSTQKETQKNSTEDSSETQFQNQTPKGPVITPVN